MKRTKAELELRVAELEQEVSFLRCQLKARECDVWMTERHGQPFQSEITNVWVWDTPWGYVHSVGPERILPPYLVELWLREYPQDSPPQGVA